MPLIEIVIEPEDVKLLRSVAVELRENQNVPTDLFEKFNTLLGRWTSMSYKNRYVLELLWDNDLPTGPPEDYNRVPVRRIKK